MNIVTHLGRIEPVLMCIVFLIYAFLFLVVVKKAKKKNGSKNVAFFGISTLVLVLLTLGVVAVGGLYDSRQVVLTNDSIESALELGKYHDFFRWIAGFSFAFLFEIFLIWLLCSTLKFRKVDKEKNTIGGIIFWLTLCSVVTAVFVFNICNELFVKIPDKDYSGWYVTEETIDSISKTGRKSKHYKLYLKYDKTTYSITYIDYKNYKKNKSAYVVRDSNNDVIAVFSAEQYTYKGK